MDTIKTKAWHWNNTKYYYHFYCNRYVSSPYLPSPELPVLQVLQIIIGVVIVGLGSGFLLNC